jgi:opacity protein-like surface antigen
MKLKTWICGMVLALATPLAMAEGTGLYGALDIGQSDIKDACNTVAAGQSCSKTSTATRVALGYQFSPMFAGELALLNGAKSTFTGTGLTAEKKADFQLALMGTFPMANQLSLLGKFGFTHSKNTYNEVVGANVNNREGSGLTLVLGAGVQYDINPQMAVRAQYETQGIDSDEAMITPLPNEGKTNLSILSAGVVYRF